MQGNLKERQLNNYLKMISEDFPFVFEEMINRLNLSYNYLSYVNLDDINSEFVITDISNEYIIAFTREIINDIDPKLLKLFDKINNDGKIIIHNNDDKDSDNCLTDANKDGKYIPNEIHITNDGNYSSVCSLVHEFMHYTNLIANLYNKSNPDNYLFRMELTEFISIYFEMYARDYLLNNYDIDKEDIDTYYRFEDNDKNARCEIMMGIPFLIYKINDRFNYNLFKENDYIESNKKVYEAIIDNFYDNLQLQISNINFYEGIKNTNFDNDLLNKTKAVVTDTFNYHFADNNYLKCTLLAYSAKKNLTKEDVLEFNKLISSKAAYDNKINKAIYKKIMNIYNNLHNDEQLYEDLYESIHNDSKKYILKGD